MGLITGDNVDGITKILPGISLVIRYGAESCYKDTY
jgi:hypothetical protein